MSRGARGWSGRLSAGEGGVLLIALVLLATSGLVGGTSALLSAQTTNPTNTYAAAALYAPASLTATASGHDVQLSWPAGLNGNGYQVLGVANGLSSNCGAVTFSNIGTSTSTSYTDAGRYSPQGAYFCYQVKTAYGSWTSQTNNPTAAVQLGFVANSVQMINAGNTTSCSGSGTQQFGQVGVLDCGDQLVLTFNQAVNTATGPTSTNTVCAVNGSDLILLASTTTTGGCSTAEAVNLGYLGNGTVGIRSARFTATYTWSNGNKTLTVTIGTRVAGNRYPSISTSTWTFAPTTNTSRLLSASGGFHICDNNGVAGSNCFPSTSSPSTF